MANGVITSQEIISLGDLEGAAYDQPGRYQMRICVATVTGTLTVRLGLEEVVWAIPWIASEVIDADAYGPRVAIATQSTSPGEVTVTINCPTDADTTTEKQGGTELEVNILVFGKTTASV